MMRRIVALLLTAALILCCAVAGIAETSGDIALDEYFGKTREEIEAAFPGAVYDEEFAMINYYGDGYGLEFDLGAEYTCYRLGMTGSYGCTLCGISFGMDAGEVTQVLETAGYTCYEDNSYINADDGNGGTVEVMFDDGKARLVFCSPAEYAEDAVTAEMRTGDYEGTAPAPVDENDLLKYACRPMETAIEELDIPTENLYDREANVGGLRVSYEEADIEYYTDEGASIDFQTGIGNSRDEYYNTGYVTAIVLEGTADTDPGYSIAGLTLSMTQDEADACIAALDSDLAAQLYFYRYDDGEVFIEWSCQRNNAF